MTRVWDYETGVPLKGVASEILIKASAAADDTGVVPAYLDTLGVWRYVAGHDVERYRARGTEVVMVYVQ